MRAFGLQNTASGKEKRMLQGCCSAVPRLLAGPRPSYRSDGGKFTYNLPEIVGEHRTAGSLVHAVHSSTNCTMLRLDGYKYWRDYGSDNQISKGMIYQPLGWTLMVDVMKLT